MAIARVVGLGLCVVDELLVVDDRKPEARGFFPVLRGHTENWTLCRSLFLPEEHQAYSGVNAVIVAGSDLSRWTDAQRMALYESGRPFIDATLRADR